jgi:hypothetical protein
VVFLLQLESEIFVYIGIFIIVVCIWACQSCRDKNKKTDPTSLETRTPSSRQDRKKYQGASTTQTIQLMMCPECEATIHAEETVCPHCGSSRPICSVCHHTIEYGESVLSCPHCKAKAHRVHILEYLKVKGTCPNCQADLDEYELFKPDVNLDDQKK